MSVKVAYKKAYKRVASEQTMLREVAFKEKVISTSFCELRLLEQHFVLDSNEKNVKAGKSSEKGFEERMVADVDDSDDQTRKGD